MITGDIKNKIDNIWITLATGDVVNPISAVEQLIYLIFHKATR